MHPTGIAQTFAKDVAIDCDPRDRGQASRMNRPDPGSDYMKPIVLLLASCAFAAVATAALAQDAAPAPAPAPASAPAPTDDGEVVVTAVARSVNRLSTSISVSSIGGEALQQNAPRSVAELFRDLPGIRSESSGGEGNANIAVRGLPVSTGGAKFVQLQEDGLGVLEYGDVIFGNSDIFTRADFNVARIESVRGGSASTLVSNAPGGVINIISKTGEQKGGAVQFTGGLDYGEYRIDADYGGRLSDSVRYHIGGFYRQGEGPRNAGYDGNKGGQVRGNITKEFAGGFFRINFKYLDDRAIAYLPSPVRVTGTNSDPHYQAIPGLSPQNDTLHSKYDEKVLTLDNNDRTRTTDIRDGMHPLVKSIGFEGSYDLHGVTISDNFRYSDVSGRFVSPFPAGVGDAQTIANGVGGAGSTIFFASGPNKGQQIANPAALNGNGLLTQIVLFNVDLNSLENVENNFRLSTKFESHLGTFELTGGIYNARQTIDTTWAWTSQLIETKGNNAALIDVRNAAGVLQTENGTVGYSASFFGGCCRRRYNVDYDTNAPFVSLGFTTGKLNLDASYRYDFDKAHGYVQADGPTVTRDVNGDGIISVPDTKTTILNAVRSPVNYSNVYSSYSFGANYRFTNDLAAFVRHSRGGRENADRILLGSKVSLATGQLNPGASAVDFVVQTEAGVKYRNGPVTLNATGFLASAAEQNYDPSQVAALQVVDRRYRSYGVELEGVLRIHGGFEIAANGTYTDSKIRQDKIDPTNVGHTPKRQADFVYSVTPQYHRDLFTIGANIVGTTDSYTQDGNQLKLPGFTQVNAFLSVRPIPRVQVSVNANNVFNTAGFTEAEEGSIPASGYVRARSINGRTVSASLRYSF